MKLRYCLPRLIGRGAGLGNELIPWARSFLAAQVLGARSLMPAFGLNPRRYWRHFGTPRYDWLAHRAIEAALPVVEFTAADHARHGGGDVTHAFRAFATEHDLFNRNRYVVATQGMWGGYGHVAAAREFVAATLFQTRFAPTNLVRIHERLVPQMPVVGMHVRLGDFAPTMEPDDYRGRFNAALPLSWYRNIAESISRQLEGQVQFLIASDGTAEQLAPLTTGLRCVLTIDLADSDCSDLLALSRTDLLVCSVSSFSAWAAFLSASPYLWYEPNLQPHPEGFHSIWGHEAMQQAPHSATRQAIDVWQATPGLKPRGTPIGADGKVSANLVNTLRLRHLMRHPAADLVQYGVAPAEPLTSLFTTTP